ncbi:hypothetical protein [Winogradskyella poriferorum]|uniref:hypothetical protein n=1 Tax=Winogradskyella poriferorum TaxID=307627 RepID=UPI003D650470
MKIFTAKLLLFLTIVFLADQTLGYLIGYFHSKTNNINLQNANYGFSGKVDEDILFFGASEVSHTFISERILNQTGYKAFNLASDGCGVYYQFPLLKTIVDKNIPKVVLISSHQLTLNETDYITRIYPYYDNNEFVKEVVDELSPKDSLKLILDGYKFNSQIIRIFDDRNTNLKGYVPLEIKDIKKGSELKKIKDGVSFEVKNETETYFKKFIEYASSKGIITYVYIPPKLENIDPVYKKTIYKLVSGSGAKVIDFSMDTTLVKEDSKYFNDVIHLNHLGAQILTDKFIEILKQDIEIK